MFDIITLYIYIKLDVDKDCNKFIEMKFCLEMNQLEKENPDCSDDDRRVQV